MKLWKYIKLIWAALPQVISILKSVEQLTPDGTKADDQIKEVIKLLEDVNSNTNEKVKL